MQDGAYCRFLGVARGSKLRFYGIVMSITRRVFMRNGALAIVGTSAVPGSSDSVRHGALLQARGISVWSGTSSSVARPTV